MSRQDTNENHDLQSDCVLCGAIQEEESEVFWAGPIYGEQVLCLDCQEKNRGADPAAIIEKELTRQWRVGLLEEELREREERERADHECTPYPCDICYPY